MTSFLIFHYRTVQYTAGLFDWISVTGVAALLPLNRKNNEIAYGC
jgi:hypothetical protein